MKCPNCNETEHEPGAKYCHVCGRLLGGDNKSSSKAARSKVNPPHEVDRSNLTNRVVGDRLTEDIFSIEEREKKAHHIILVAIAAFISLLEFAACAASSGWGWGIVSLLANIAFVAYRVFYLEEVGYTMDWDDSDERRKAYLFSFVPFGVLSVFVFCIRNGWMLLVLPIVLCLYIIINKKIHDTFY